MPIYEYKCEDCGAVSEVLVRNTQTQEAAVCTACQSTRMSRLISVPGAVFSKGGSPSAVPPGTCPNAGSCGVASCPSRM
ncbi:MAG: FmdB family zinc ribbon protein [Candidatus Omnitrophota bacterium]